MLTATNLVFRAGAPRADRHASPRSFEPGRLHLIIGPNGAGKSTLIRLLARAAATRRRACSLRRTATWRTRSERESGAAPGRAFAGGRGSILSPGARTGADGALSAFHGAPGCKRPPRLRGGDAILRCRRHGRPQLWHAQRRREAAGAVCPRAGADLASIGRAPPASFSSMSH